MGNDPGQLVVVVVWQLELQLPMQSVAIITKVVSSNPAHGEKYQIQHYVIKFVIDLWQVSGFLQALRFRSPNKPERLDMTEILLKVALNTITLALVLDLGKTQTCILTFSQFFCSRDPCMHIFSSTGNSCLFNTIFR